MKVLLNADFNIGKIGVVKNTRTNNIFTSTAIQDTVSFSGNIKTHKINVDKETAAFVANSLSTSTSGHRATYGSKTFNEDVVKLIYNIKVRSQVEREQVAKPTGESCGDEEPTNKTVKKSAKIGRNDPCPCGSGKKYKKCCGM